MSHSMEGRMNHRGVLCVPFPITAGFKQTLLFQYLAAITNEIRTGIGIRYRFEVRNLNLVKSTNTRVLQFQYAGDNTNVYQIAINL